VFVRQVQSDNLHNSDNRVVIGRHNSDNSKKKAVTILKIEHKEIKFMFEPNPRQ
jgi:hypothetical protein